MSDWGVKFIRFTCFDPVFKGGATLAVGLLALLFALWMRGRWKEPLQIGFLVYIAVSILVIFFGLFVLIFQPQWWKLPY